MNLKQSFVFVAIVACFVTESFSQPEHYNITNGFGIFGGITQFDIITDNFNTSKQTGFIGGMSATVDIPHRWYNISFGMQLSENNIGIGARPENLTVNEMVDYKLFAAQIALLGHIKVGGNYFTIDAGPMLQYNSKLELKDKDQANLLINNYNNLRAEDITNISQFNVNGLIGATLGYKFLKLRAQYIYGVMNSFKKLNNQNLDTSGGEATFKGNQSMLVLGAMISF